MKLFSVLSVLPAVALGVAPFQNLFRLNCDGSVEILSNLPMGVNVKVPISNFINVAFDEIYGRVQCACPNASKNDFRGHFDPFYVAIDGLDGKLTADNECIAKNFPRTVRDLSLLRFENLPSSCNLDSFANGNGCNMKHPFPLMDANLELSLFSCSDSWTTGISLTCSGDACANMGKPCLSDVECGGSNVLKCFDLQSHLLETTTLADIDDSIFGFLQDIYMQGPNDVSPGCFMSRGNSARSEKNDVVLSLLTFVRNSIFSAAGSATSMKFCGINEIVDFDLLFSNKSSTFSINDTALANIEGSTSNQTSTIASCISSNEVVVKVPGMIAWDGKDSTGKQVNSYSTIIPPLQKKSSLFELTCDQKAFLPSHNVGATFFKMPILVDYFTNLIKSIVSCRTTPAMGDNEFLTRFGIWEPLFLLYGVDVKKQTTYSQMVDLLHEVFDFSNPNRVRISNLPNSCNYERYVKEGICEIDFRGIQELLSLEMVFRFTAQTCSGSPHFSSFKIECLGADCPILLGLQKCGPASPCFGKTKCQYLFDFVSGFASNIVEILDPDHNQGTDVFTNATRMEDIALNIDWFDLFMSPEMGNTDTCAFPSAFNNMDPFDEFVTNTTKIYGKDGLTCKGKTIWRSEVAKHISTLLGSPNQPSGQTSYLSYCLVGPNIIANVDFEDWALNLIHIDNTNLVTLSESFANVESTTVATPTPTDSSSIISIPTLSLILLSFIFSVFFF